MFVRSIWQCKHEHQKGANTHNLVSNIGLSYLFFLSPAVLQRTPRGTRTPV